MIYTDLSFEDYCSLPGLNSSLLKIFDKSPLHAKYWLDGELRQSDTGDLIMGRAVHKLILEPDNFNKEFVKGPDCRRGTNEWKAFLPIAGNRTILKPDEFDQAFQIAMSVQTDPNAGPLFKNIQSELSLDWEMGETKCKARLDAYNPTLRAIVDLKTTTDASHRSFSKTLEERRYYRQAAYYITGAAFNSIHIDHFYFVAVEKELPYSVATYKLDPYLISLARKENSDLIKKFAECKRTNNWPGYTEKIEAITLPEYAMNKLEEKYGEPI